MFKARRPKRSEGRGPQTLFIYVPTIPIDKFITESLSKRGNDYLPKTPLQIHPSSLIIQMR